MLHFGDVTKINGAEVPEVDIITFGAPCQDLSVAGKRAGMKNIIMGDEETTRSGLFFEAIRIIKEMRDESRRKHGGADECIRPRFAVYENVPGAFSSNKGEDFRAVLEETAKVADKDAVIPGPPKGKWTHAGCIMGDGWSIAWRVHDAQFWGVPQRRKRISLVADFGGECAPEILFERKGVSGDITESGKARKDAATDVERSSGETSAVGVLNDQGGGVMNVSEGVTGTLRAQEHGHQPIVYGISAYDSNSMKSGNPNSGIYEAETARTLDLNGGSPACNQGGMAVVCIEGNGSRESHKGNGYVESEIMYTLNTIEKHAVCVENHPQDSRVKIKDDGICQTLDARMGMGGGNVPMVMEPYNGTTGSFMRVGNDGIAETLAARDYKDPQYVYLLRRLTPLEAERLQGFPDHWTDIGDWVDSKGKKHKGESDSPRYKALGNSIALPFWEWMAKRMVRLIKNDEPTMASLFSGIGGFELAFARAGVKPVWASEVEEFAIAVTKLRFPKEKNNE